MSEWLDLMLDEVARKQREEAEAREERKRRDEQRPADATEPPPGSDQSK